MKREVRVKTCAGAGAECREKTCRFARFRKRVVWQIRNCSRSEQTRDKSRRWEGEEIGCPSGFVALSRSWWAEQETVSSSFGRLVLIIALGCASAGVNQRPGFIQEDGVNHDTAHRDEAKVNIEHRQWR